MILDVLRSLPKHEIAQFRKFIMQYQKGDVILQEGFAGPHRLHLLRAGTVGVFRTVDGQEQLLTTIQAINFIGEMELIAGGPTISTVKALTDVVTYCFDRPDFESILQNASWADKLVSRLGTDLTRFSDQVVMLEAENLRLQREMEQMKEAQASQARGISLLFTLLRNILSKAMIDSTVKSKSWNYIAGLDALLSRFAQHYLPAVSLRKTRLTDEEIEELERNGVLKKAEREWLGQRDQPPLSTN